MTMTPRRPMQCIASLTPRSSLMAALAAMPVTCAAPQQQNAAAVAELPVEAASAPAGLVARHWGTIVPSTEPPFEPPQRFRAAGRAEGLHDDALWAMAIGETRPLDETPAPVRSASANATAAR
jgi:hypothetical protein